MSIAFELTPEQEEVKKQAREFGEREIAPFAAEIDEKDQMPWDLWRKMAQPPYKYTGIHIPEEYGGAPRPLLDICLIAEEMTFGGKIALAGMIMEAPGLAPGAILRGGGEEQKKKYLLPITRGEGIGCFALTEPGGGSDAAALETVAELRNGKYVLNGRKRYVSFAHVGEWLIVFAKTDPTKGARGISAFVVEKGTPGFSVIEKIPVLGCRGHQDEEVLFQNCEIPKENLLGEEGKGFKVALGSLDETRTTLSAGFVGLARAALEESVNYAKVRRAFGQYIAEFEAVCFPLAEVAIEIEAARLLTFKAAVLADKGIRHTVETAAAKEFSSRLLLKAANLAVEVYGGFGCTKRHPVERIYRDARTWVFAQGAPTVQKLIVARNLFPELKIM
ncbi:MAG: acyl-CoA dehydrogenase family protein [Chloroflexota bacterium]|nr:acyl-CoA dehydrogenase family protein [Chloroflexota bacterium]